MLRNYLKVASKSPTPQVFTATAVASLSLSCSDGRWALLDHLLAPAPEVNLKAACSLD